MIEKPAPDVAARIPENTETALPLMGRQIGPYVIASLLDAGGMGELYRARDTKLGRDVAIKILPAEFTADADRQARLSREARVLAALNHPNIAQIYRLEESGDIRALVMELVPGRTLDEVIRGIAQSAPVTGKDSERPFDSGRRRALSVKQALDFARQLADGLGAAHEKGVIHRDLKPANIKVTPDGSIKVLDFGLAMASTGDAPDLDLSQRLTITLDATPQGMISGTPAYMSPEQARGQSVDKRTDIWAFGCVLYEMLTGRAAFGGGTTSDTIAKVLEREPNWEALPEGTPATIRRLLQRCLRKDPKQRLHDIADVRIEIDEALDPADVQAPSESRSPAATRPRRLLWSAGLVLAGAGVGLVALWFVARSDFASSPPGRLMRSASESWLIARLPGIRSAAPSFQRLTFRRGALSAARFVQDNHTVVYSAAWDGGPLTIYTTRMESPDSTPLPIPSAALFAISPAGEMAMAIRPAIRPPLIAYEGTLAHAPLGGGGPRELVADVSVADWSPDGSRLAIVTEGSTPFLSQGKELQFPVGRSRYTSKGSISHARVAPNGQEVAFIEHTGLNQEDRGSVVVLDSSNTARRWSEDWASIGGLAWTPAGDELWFSASRKGNARDLWAVDHRGRLRLVMSVPGGLTLHDLDANWRALISLDRHRDGILGGAPGEQQERDLSWLDWSNTADLSRDGKWLLFTEFGGGNASDSRACLRGTDGSPVIALGDGVATSLSSDAKWAIAIVQRPRAHLVLYPTGAGTERTLDPGTVTSFVWASWFPDGGRIVFAGAEDHSEPRTWIQDLRGGAPHPVTQPGTMGYGVTADGRFVIAQDTLVPIEGGPVRRLTGWTPGDIPAGGSLHSPEMYVWRYGELPGPVFRLDLTSGQRTLWKKLMPADAAGLTSLGPITVSADGRAYAYTYTRFLSDLYLVDGLK